MRKANINLDLVEDGAKIRELVDSLPLLKRMLQVTGLKSGPGRPKAAPKKKAAAKKAPAKKAAAKKTGRRRGPGRPTKNA